AVLDAAMFSQLKRAGVLMAEAGVPAAIPLGRQAIFVDTTNGFRTGLAIANPNTSSIEIHLELMTVNGQMLASQLRTLGPLQQFSFFVDEVFAGMPPMVGRLQFYCTNPMVFVGLCFIL